MDELAKLAEKTISATTVFAGVSGGLLLRLVSDIENITLVEYISGWSLFLGFVFGLMSVTIGPTLNQKTIGSAIPLAVVYWYNVVVVAVHIMVSFALFLASFQFS